MTTPREIGSPLTRIEQRSARVFVDQMGSLERAMDVLKQFRQGKPTVEELDRQKVTAALAWASTQLFAPVRIPDILAAYELFLRGNTSQLPDNEPPTLETGPDLRNAVNKKITQLKPESKKRASR